MGLHTRRRSTYFYLNTALHSSSRVVLSRVRRRLDVEVPSYPQLDARADVHRDELLKEKLACVRDLQVRELVRALQPLAHLAAARAADQAARAANRRREGIRAHLHGRVESSKMLGGASQIVSRIRTKCNGIK